MSIEDLKVKWTVEKCPCDYQNCLSALIQPSIVTVQGDIDRDTAEHIVLLHNRWLEEQTKQ